MTPLVSVIVPSYDAERHLALTIGRVQVRSAAAQDGVRCDAFFRLDEESEDSNVLWRLTVPLCQAELGLPK